MGPTGTLNVTTPQFTISERKQEQELEYKGLEYKEPKRGKNNQPKKKKRK
jgi:hypothetical protein